METNAAISKEDEYISNMDYIHEYQGNFPDFMENSTKNITEIYKLCSEHADIYLFGNDKNWKDDFRNHHEIISILKREKIDTIYIPDPSGFTGYLCKPSDFKEEFEINGLKVLTDARAEGLVIPPKSAMLIYTADCPTIIYHDIENDILIASHAGLQSIIDKPKILTGQPSKNHETVIHDIMMNTKSEEHYEIIIVGGIGWESFKYSPSHRDYGKSNMKILRYLRNYFGDNAVPNGLMSGNISISAIIKQQFISYGLSVDYIRNDGIDTGTDKRLWSHYRSHKEGKSGCGRNAVLVLHK